METLKEYLIAIWNSIKQMYKWVCNQFKML